MVLLDLRRFECLVFLVVCFWWRNGVSAASCNGPSIFIKRAGYRPPDVGTLLFNSSTPGVGVTLQCFNSCNNLADCPAFYIDYDVSACYYIPADPNTTTNSSSSPLVESNNVNYFTRVCVPAVPRTCLASLWSVDVVHGYRLNGFDTRSYSDVTVNDCAAFCYNETKFTCRSAGFWATKADGLGQCQLSREDRRTQSGSYSAVPDEVQYLENQCVWPQNGSCSLNDFPNSTLTSFNDVTIANTTLDQCEQRCLSERRFICRGYSYQPDVTSTTASSCQIHSDDTFDLGPAAVVAQPGGVYRERVACLNLFVRCNATMLNITLSTSSPFSGLMYARDLTAPSCSQSGASTTTTTLMLSIVSLPGTPSCGSVTTALENNANVTRVSRIASTVLVVQFNSIVQTVADRTVRVSCNIDSQPPPDLVVSNNTITVNVGNGNSGVSNVTVNGSSGLPTIRVRIADLGTGSNVTTVTTLGEKLQFRIDVNPANAPYGIRVYNLTATDASLANSQLLIDSAGCPTSPAIFPGLYREPGGSYAANFSAFRITNSALVRFNLTIHFCEVACQALVCNNGVPAIVNRLRRQDGNESQATNQVGSVDKSNNQSRSKLPDDMAYQFDLIVKNKIYEERKIIGRAIVDNATIVPTIGLTNPTREVATADVAEPGDYVCLMYSTFLGMLFGWAILQVVVFIAAFCFVRHQMSKQDVELQQKLQDDLNEFDNLQRRVHWSENIEAVAAT